LRRHDVSFFVMGVVDRVWTSIGIARAVGRSGCPFKLFIRAFL
jgi:hypothetical protein